MDAARFEIHHGDCLDVMRTMPDCHFDSIVTDPPYPCIDRSYGRWTEQEWHAMMDRVVAECRRILKPSGSAVFILQPNSERVGRMRPWLWEFMAKWTREWGMVQDAWWWNHAAMPEAHAIQGRLMRPSLKACVWLGPHDCYRDQDSVLWTESQRNAAVRLTARAGRISYPSGHSADAKIMTDAAVKRGGVTPFNVIPVTNTNSTNSAGSHGHGAGTPINLARWWTRYICPPGGLVLDPFGGSGTMALAAMAENRRSVLIERNEEYCEIARCRIEAAARATADDTPSMFDGR